MSCQRTFEAVKERVALVRATAGAWDKLAMYDTWAENYDQAEIFRRPGLMMEQPVLGLKWDGGARLFGQAILINSPKEPKRAQELPEKGEDVVTLDFQAPAFVAKIISSHYSGDPEGAVVLDVACGTGMVAKQMKDFGFAHFVGIDGSKLMLEEAKNKGLYQDLKQCILVQEPLPAQTGSYDVVIICGALTVDHVAVSVIRELCHACKPGGLVCMACRHGEDSVEYKASLERELKEMEMEGLWSCVDVTEIEKWSKSLTAAGDKYISGSVYLYKKV